MASSPTAPVPAGRAQPRTDRLVIDLLLPQSPSCAPCQDAIEEIDGAVALLAPELAARDHLMQVRVTTGARPPLELRVDGVAIEPDGTHDCGDGGAVRCGTWDWDGTAYAVPPAELLTDVIQHHLDGDTAAARP